MPVPLPIISLSVSPCPSRFVVTAVSSGVKAVEVCWEIFGQPFLGAFGMGIASNSCKSRLFVTLQPPVEPRVGGVVGWLYQILSSPCYNSSCFIEHQFYFPLFWHGEPPSLLCGPLQNTQPTLKHYPFLLLKILVLECIRRKIRMGNTKHNQQGINLWSSCCC